MMTLSLKVLLISASVAVISGCSSVMTHTGGQQGYYPGTKASYQLLSDDQTTWGLKPFVALDMPFTAVMDTVLLPWDMLRTDKSARAKVEESERRNQAINDVIPPVTAAN
ncbi:YceK/YidQ family lipoprotein [Shimwellia blattae]